MAVEGWDVRVELNGERRDGIEEGRREGGGTECEVDFDTHILPKFFFYER